MVKGLCRGGLSAKMVLMCKRVAMHLTKLSEIKLRKFYDLTNGKSVKSLDSEEKARAIRSALVDFASVAHLHPDNFKIARFIDKVVPIVLVAGLIASGGYVLGGVVLQAVSALGLSAELNAAATFFVAGFVAAACSIQVIKKIVQERTRLPVVPAAPKDCDAEVNGIYANIKYATWQSRVLYPAINVLSAYALLAASVRAGFVLVPSFLAFGMSQTLAALLTSSVLVMLNVAFRVMVTVAVRDRRASYRNWHKVLCKGLQGYNTAHSLSLNKTLLPNEAGKVRDSHGKSADTRDDNGPLVPVSEPTANKPQLSKPMGSHADGDGPSTNMTEGDTPVTPSVLPAGNKNVVATQDSEVLVRPPSPVNNADPTQDPILASGIEAVVADLKDAHQTTEAIIPVLSSQQNIGPDVGPLQDFSLPVSQPAVEEAGGIQLLGQTGPGSILDAVNKRQNLAAGEGELGDTSRFPDASTQSQYSQPEQEDQDHEGEWPFYDARYVNLGSGSTPERTPANNSSDKTGAESAGAGLDFLRTASTETKSLGGQRTPSSDAKRLSDVSHLSPTIFGVAELLPGAVPDSNTSPLGSDRLQFLGQVGASTSLQSGEDKSFRNQDQDQLNRLLGFFGGLSDSTVPRHEDEGVSQSKQPVNKKVRRKGPKYQNKDGYFPPVINRPS